MSKDSTPLSWRIKERPGFTTVEFTGEIDENADFSELRRQLRGAVVFRLSDIHRINSCGVREWVNFVRDLPNVSELTFSHCSPAIVTQLNMIYNFLGPATRGSVPSTRRTCARSATRRSRSSSTSTRTSRTPVGDPPEFVCDTCKQSLQFDDLPERYLSFLTEA